jgi:hypothetical protein
MKQEDSDRWSKIITKSSPRNKKFRFKFKPLSVIPAGAFYWNKQDAIIVTCLLSPEGQ